MVEFYGTRMQAAQDEDGFVQCDQEAIPKCWTQNISKANSPRF